MTVEECQRMVDACGAASDLTGDVKMAIFGPWATACLNVDCRLAQATGFTLVGSAPMLFYSCEVGINLRNLETSNKQKPIGKQIAQGS